MEHSEHLWAKKFSERYSRQILHTLESVSEVMDVKVDFKLTFMKPLHPKWLSEFCSYINSADGQEITRNGDFLDISSDISSDFVVNKNPSQVKFTCSELGIR